MFRFFTPSCGNAFGISVIHHAIPWLAFTCMTNAGSQVIVLHNCFCAKTALEHAVLCELHTRCLSRICAHWCTRKGQAARKEHDPSALGRDAPLLSDIMFSTDKGWESRWVKSSFKSSDEGPWVWTAGKYYGDPNNKGECSSKRFFLVFCPVSKELHILLPHVHLNTLRLLNYHLCDGRYPDWHRLPLVRFVCKDTRLQQQGKDHCAPIHRQARADFGLRRRLHQVGTQGTQPRYN